MWICGFCGEPAWKFYTGDLEKESDLAVMAWHALEARQVDMGLLDRAQGNGREWVLPDGRVWLRRK